ncbi:MAG: GLPGLI family protein [Weeksellaceae bacterium]
MKKLIIIILTLFPFTIQAQESIKVTYEATYSYDENQSGIPFPGIFLSTIYELTVSGNLSEFRYIEKPLPPKPEGGNSLVLLVSNDYLIDLNTKKYFTEMETFDKSYLVSDDLPKADWILTGEEKEIAGEPVKKAVFKMENGNEITAWYAPGLIYRVGPDLYSGLPGVILQLDIRSEIHGGAIMGTHFKAKKIDFLKDKVEIKLPEGKTIKKEEASQIRNQNNS